MTHPDPTWWPVTVTWDDDQIEDEIFATTHKEAKDAAAECWPGATITVLAEHATWTDTATNFTCLTTQAGGVWSGYVSVLDDHPWWGAAPSDLADLGITHSAAGGGPVGYHRSGAPDGRWWVGGPVAAATFRQVADQVAPLALAALRADT